jgi:hypothetical protein
MGRSFVPKFLMVAAASIAMLIGTSILVAGKVQGPSAIFNYSRGHDKLSVLRRPAQMFAIQPEVGICKKLKFITSYGSFTAPLQSKVVPAGVPVNLYAQNMMLLEGWPSRVEGHCAASVTFTPVAGAKYEIKQLAVRPGVCDLSVADEATGAAPTDMKVNQVRPCGGYM